MKDPLKVYWQPRLPGSSLVVGWNADAGNLGARVIDYLNKKLGAQSFGEIEPVEFFSLGGVAIENDLVQFPESKFYVCPEKNLVVLKSDAPSQEWYRFLTVIMDAAELCQVKEVYTIGGMVSLSAHTALREMRGTFNSPELKAALSFYNLAGGLDYETPPGQRPTLNSFLLWAAKKRNLPAVSLWVPIPFYLVAVEDLRAEERVLDFFNRRLGLAIDFSDLDAAVRRQNMRLAEARRSFPDIDESIRRLEGNLMPSAEENQKLAQDIEELLREKKD